MAEKANTECTIDSSNKGQKIISFGEGYVKRWEISIQCIVYPAFICGYNLKLMHKVPVKI